MTYISTQYKMTVFAKRSGSVETTPLRTALDEVSGSLFVVGTGIFATEYSGSGSQFYTAPYMDTPRGGTGVFQLPDFKLQVGSYTVKLYDKRIGQNFERWVTQFIGDTSGSFSLVGRKVHIEESTDEGQNWSSFFVGRISEFAMDDELTYSVTIRDAVEELKSELFYQLPLVDYAVYQSALPVGLKEPLYGFTGSRFIPQVSGLKAEFSRYPSTGFAQFGVSATSINNKVNDIGNLLFTRPTTNTLAGYINESTTGGDTLENLRCAIVGVGEYRVEQMVYIVKGDNRRAAMVDFTVSELPTDDSAYTPTGSLATNTVYDFFLYSAAPQPDKPVWLGPVHPMDVAADVLDGKFFSPTPDGTRLTVAYDTASLNTVKDQLGIDSVTFRIDEPMPAIEFIENYICKPFQVGMTVESVVIDNVPQSQIRFFSTKLPEYDVVDFVENLNTPFTLTDGEIVAGAPIRWEPNAPIRRIQGTYYLESPQDIDDQIKRGVSASDVEVVKEYDYPVVLLDISDTETSAGTLQLDFNGLRAIARVSPSAVVSGIQDVDTETAVKGKTVEFLNEFYNRFATGPITVNVTAAYNATAAQFQIGKYLLVEISALPNPESHIRGGTRLMQIIGASREEQSVRLTLLDSGRFLANDVLSALTVTSEGSNRVLVEMTTTERAQVNVQVAVVPLSASQPAAGDARWTTRALPIVEGTSTVTLAEMPAGYTLFVRARTETPPGELYKLPSAWFYADTFVQPVIPAPSNLTITNITRRRANAEWTNTATGSIEVYLASPQSSVLPDFVQVGEVPALSTYYPLRGLDLNTSPSHSVWIRYRAEYGGYSEFASASFIAAGSSSLLPPLDPLIIYVGA